MLKYSFSKVLQLISDAVFLFAFLEWQDDTTAHANTITASNVPYLRPLPARNLIFILFISVIYSKFPPPERHLSVISSCREDDSEYDSGMALGLNIIFSPFPVKNTIS